MVGFSTGPQKETQLRRPGCIHGVKQMEIKWESCLIINHENRVLKLHRRETWTIAARNRRRSYSITGVFWGAAFTFRRRRRPLLPLRLPQLYPTSIRSGCLAIAEGYNHSITLKCICKIYLHDERAVFIAVLIQGVQLSNSVVKCLNLKVKIEKLHEEIGSWNKGNMWSQILSSKAGIISLREIALTHNVHH